VFRVWDRLAAYGRLGFHTWRSGASLPNLLRTQFPFLVPDAPVPPMVTVEFTNICNLKCAYCTSPLALRPQGYVSDETFDALIRSLRESKVERVRVVGNGEPTLHPEFPRLVAELASATSHLAVLSNGQWKRPQVTRSLIAAPVDLIEITVGGDDAVSYARNRVGGRLDRVLGNLADLRAERARVGSNNLINVRVNLRPSDLAHRSRIVGFWRRHADTVFVQYVAYRGAIGDPDDVFHSPMQLASTYPRCTLTLKDIGVEWNGSVPVCSGSVSQLGAPGMLLGNIRERSLAEMWNGARMRQYREAHRRRAEENMPMCRGCGQGV
jgi:MoaA/NifB/PqqE/SkfB family radical SAM enzyme